MRFVTYPDAMRATNHLDRFITYLLRIHWTTHLSVESRRFRTQLGREEST